MGLSLIFLLNNIQYEWFDMCFICKQNHKYTHNFINFLIESQCFNYLISWLNSNFLNHALLIADKKYFYHYVYICCMSLAQTEGSRVG